MAAKHIVLTGAPGVGKTTLVKQVVNRLQKQNIAVNGFYTEEERGPEGKRVGFKIITIDGKTAQLASTGSSSSKRVGQYGVEVEQFERLAVPQLHGLPGPDKGVLVIDEIGKMELFSGQFKSAVTKAFASDGFVILATIPIAKGKPIEFVENIRSNSKVKLFTVDKSNRNSLHDCVISSILQAQKDL